jgi:hypothetical protein
MNLSHWSTAGHGDDLVVDQELAQPVKLLLRGREQVVGARMVFLQFLQHLFGRLVWINSLRDVTIF